MDAHFYALYEKLYRQQNRDFPLSEAFLKHLAFLLAKADIMVTDWHGLRTVSHDPKWYRSPTEPPEAIQQFYVLPLPVLRNRAGVPSDMPPAPRRAAPDRNMSEVIHLAFTHATNQGNFVAIMREGRLAASKFIIQAVNRFLLRDSNLAKQPGMIMNLGGFFTMVQPLVRMNVV